MVIARRGALILPQRVDRCPHCWCSNDCPGKAHVLASWKIENVDARNQKASLEEIERFPEQYGCPLDVFPKALNDPDAKKAKGPVSPSYTNHDRVSRQLKKAGLTKMTTGVVVRFHALLQKHRPELFPPPAPSTVHTPTTASGENIVPFRKSSGDDGPKDDGRRLKPFSVRLARQPASFSGHLRPSILFGAQSMIGDVA